MIFVYVTVICSISILSCSIEVEREVFTYYLALNLFVVFLIIAKRDENKPIPGGWSDWSTWTSCTKSCAGGVRYRERTCTEPAPKFGGEYCEGEGEDAQACNTEKCEPGDTMKN